MIMVPYMIDIFFFSHYAHWAGGLCRATSMYEYLQVSTKNEFD